MTRGERLGGAAILVLLVALFHGPSLGGGFVYDDHWTIVENGFLRTPASSLAALPGPGPARAGVPDAGRPVMVATEIADFALWRLDPRGYHLQSLLWHAAVAVLFLLVAGALTGSFPVAFAAAAVFAVHPAHVEAVAAINYREDLLAAFFLVAALAVLVAGRGCARRPAARIAAGALLLVGALAKESAMVAPLLLILADVVRPPPPEERRAARLDWLALGAAALVAGGWRAWVMGAAGVVSRTAAVPAAHRVLSYAVPEAAYGFVVGLLRLIVPFGRFSAEYDDVRPWALRWGAVVLVAAGCLLAWRLRRRQPIVALGLAGAVVAWLPTAGFVPIGNLRADRYLYLPSLGFLLALAALVVPRLERLPVLRGRPIFELPRPWLAVAVIVVALGLETRRETRIWHDDLALWRRATQVAPRSPRAWNALAEAHLRAGQPGGAALAARRSLALADDAQGRAILGLSLLAGGDPTGARAALEGALARAEPPDRPALLNDLGLAELAMGRLDDALAHFAEARRQAPGYDRPWLNAARALAIRGRRTEGESLLRDLLRASPASSDGWALLGAILEARGEGVQARAAYDRARRLGDVDPARAAALLAPPPP